MDLNFRFILEEPHGGAPQKGQQRKRARLVTACDACRVKKIKCIRTPKIQQCEACRVSNGACLYGDRDRYQAERGLSYSYATQIIRADSQDNDQKADGQSPPPLNGYPRSGSSVDGHSSYPSSHHSDSGFADPQLEQLRPGSRKRKGSPLAEDLISPDARFPSPHGPQSILDGTKPDTSGNAGNTIGDLKRITVPFFRYFGPTANTPGYRRVKVRTLTLDDGASVGSHTSQASFSPAADLLPSPKTRSSFPQPPSSPPIFRALHPNSNAQANGEDEEPLNNDHGHDAGSSGPATGTTTPVHPHIPSFESSVMATAAASGRDCLFDPARPRYPNPKYLGHLASLFFDHLACHFPFLDRSQVMAQITDGTLPAILANCLAALAVRFSNRKDLLKGPRHLAGEAYCDMAKLLVVHMLSWPSVEVLQALVLIAWSEFGSGRDSGLWMYSRMAVGMAMDLGLGFEATVQLAATESEREKVRLTWWSTLLIDRINSWGTGRPIAIADDQFDTALPALTSTSEDSSHPPPTSFVFGHLCRLVQLRGKLGDVLNNKVKRPGALDLDETFELSQLQHQMTTFYQSLPPSLVFNIQNFRRYSCHNQAAIFLLLHAMFHSVITLLHRPSLLQNFTPDVTLPLATSIDLSRSSARSIVDMVILADEVDQQALLANPFLDLTVLTAARAFLAERETLTKPPPNMSAITAVLTRQWSEASLERCKAILAKMSKYWGGVECVRRILDQQSVGDMDFDVGEPTTGDSHISHLRDVELITQWAAKAWRRHVANGQRKRAPDEFKPHGGDLSGFEMSFNTSGSIGSSEKADSPAGASVGITGFLDGPAYGSDLPDFLTDQNALRVSFNAAEADLSFSNSSELFNIPEGFEEFLIRQAGLDNMPVDNPSDDLVAPAFSTLIGPWFPMGQHLSRAPSPTRLSSRRSPQTRFYKARNKMYGPLGLSFASQVKASRGLHKFLTPIAAFYARAVGHRRMGLRYDDLLIEERSDVQKALSRLPEKEAYDRAFRQRVAVQQSVLHKDLPKDQWLKPEEDIRYLKPYVDQVAKEDYERAEWDTITVTKTQH
ncbi:ubiquinol-cytochrome C reductase complex 14kD subunit [Ceratobasidium sp. AG-Ba]|nr:ubiquinol-cytochrome C reductase complex 14kD subunit [Ceratobasidium sp. AG-Ba]